LSKCYVPDVSVEPRLLAEPPLKPSKVIGTVWLSWTVKAVVEIAAETIEANELHFHRIWEV
jgi:hypothetical protein